MIIVAFLIVVIVIVVAIAGDLKRMKASLGRRDRSMLLNIVFEERHHPPPCTLSPAANPSPNRADAPS
jgi:hypothetical protein